MLPRKRSPYPGELPAFRFEVEPNLKRITANAAQHRVAARVSISKLRRRKREAFDYEAYRAGFAKRYVSTMSSTDALAFLTYNILTTTWKKTSETGLQTFPTRRPCTLTFIIKFMIYFIQSSSKLCAHHRF